MRRARPLLGTFVEVEASGLAEPAQERAIGAAFEAIERVHRLMSFHDPESDISRLNRRAASTPIAVDPWTAKVLRSARMLFDATDGLFDCAVGYQAMQRGLLPSQDLDHVERGTFSAVEFLSDDRIGFTAKIAIDLGGIAKGFAVDRAVATLRARGAREALVNAGGDLRVIGPTPRTVHIRCPGSDGGHLRAGLLRNAAIATSDALTTIGRRDMAQMAPALDASRCAYSVVAPTCWLADALTKVLIQLGDPTASCFAAFGARAFITSPDALAGEAA